MKIASNVFNISFIQRKRLVPGYPTLQSMILYIQSEITWRFLINEVEIPSGEKALVL